MKKNSLLLFALIVVALTAACGGSSPSDPSDPTPTPTPATEHVTITFTVLNQSNQVIQPDADGVWRVPANSYVFVRVDFKIPSGTYFNGKLTYWNGSKNLLNDVRVGVGGNVPKGTNAAIVDITENGSYNQQKVARIVGQ